ncbi:hypothetical protein [Cognatishimia sp. F0-27]|uniref:hypothetical protein n=1 Tax=Cognatishimia sp. F0-27 TaxID=2816855 RepID=UPI001D0BF670|nr:hypothetical protein [Cognatishimia sp. F0-27]MCC1493329.1 hypothetical protein [Cognatishimia sp. F0-27]
MIGPGIGSAALIGVLCALIVCVAVFRAWVAIRNDKHQGRGSLPGKGYHTIDASYHSGGSGGGHSAEFRVPKDPQVYARLFIPKDKTK